MNVKNILIISDNNTERISELNFIAEQFASGKENIDAIIFVKDGEELNAKVHKIYGIKELPVNSIDAVADVAKNYDLILTSGYVGASLGGILVYKLGISCVFGVNEIDYDNFIFRHSAYGDKAVIDYKPNRLPLLILIKERNFEQSLPSYDNPETEWIDVEKTVELVEEKPVEKEVELDKAKIVVGGGRGVGSKDGFEVLKKLAGLLNGVLGASRAAVDNGWMPHQYQVGQSGAMLSANLYFAFGISGATQHLSGIKNVKCVVAINTDEEAPIFKRARYNIISDWKEFATALINQLEGEKNG